MKWEGEGRVYKFIYIYIYISFFGNFSFNRVGFEAGFTKTQTLLGPTLGFILKIQTQHYCFAGRVF